MDSKDQRFINEISIRSDNIVGITMHKKYITITIQ